MDTSKIDHSKFAWRAQNNSIGNLSLNSNKTEIRPDKDGLSPAERRRIEEIKFKQANPELFEGDVF